MAKGTAEAEVTTPEVESELVEINVESRKTGRKISFAKDLGTSLEDAVDKFGAQVVFNLFRSAAVIKCQAPTRATLDNEEKSEDDAIEVGQNWKPGIVAVRKGGAKKDPIAALAEKVKSGELTMEQLTALIAARIGQ